MSFYPTGRNASIQSCKRTGLTVITCLANSACEHSQRGSSRASTAIAAAARNRRGFGLLFHPASHVTSRSIYDPTLETIGFGVFDAYGPDKSKKLAPFGSDRSASIPFYGISVA